MKKITTAFLIVLALACMTSCDIFSLFKKSNSCEFTVTKGSSTQPCKWPAEYDTVGFLKADNGNYCNIFSASDSHQDSNTFYNYLFLGTPSNAVGTYGSSSVLDPVSYYDANGDLFMVFSSDTATKSEIAVTKWDSAGIIGTFTATLRNVAGAYVTLSGSFKSFENSASRGLVGLSESIQANSRNIMIRKAVQ